MKCVGNKEKKKVDKIHHISTCDQYFGDLLLYSSPGTIVSQLDARGVIIVKRDIINIARFTIATHPASQLGYFRTWGGV